MPGPDWLPDFKAWLKGNSTLVPLHGGRVFFRIPSASAFPLLRIYQSGGGAENRGEFPVLYNVRAGIEVWGNGPTMYDAVRSLTKTLESVLNDAAPQFLNAPSLTYLDSAWVTTTVDSPDPDQGWPRYVVDVVLTVKLAA